MKKIIAFLLAALTLLSLAACTGGGTPAAGGGPAGGSAESAPPEKTSKPSGGAGLPEMFQQQAAIEETVLVDEMDVKITATELTYTNYSAELALVLENNSDKDLSFYSNTLSYACNSINGFMVDDGYLNTDVPAGKKANETLSFSTEELAVMGITGIADIEVGFDIEDDDSDTYLRTGPISLKTSIADTFAYPDDAYQDMVKSGALSAYGLDIDYFAQDELYSSGGVRVISEMIAANEDGETALLLEMENTSSQQLYVSAGNFSLNGLMIQSGTWTTDSINPGKRRVASYPLASMLDAAYWEDYGLTGVSEVAFSLTLRDMELNELQAAAEVTVAVPGGGGSFSTEGQVLSDADGIRVIAKGIEEDSFSYSDDVHILLLIENNSPKAVTADVDYDSLSVNGYVTDFICYSRKIPAGKSGILDVELTGSSLEDNRIEEIGDIEEVEMTLEFRDDHYNTIAEPVVTFTVKE